MQDNSNNFLVCSKCGTANAANTNFCINCGSPLVSNQNVAVNNQMNVNDPNLGMGANVTSIPEQPVNYTSVHGLEQPVGNVVTSPINQGVVTNSKMTKSFHYFKYIISSFLRPYQSFKDNEEEMSNFKNIGILALIVIGIMAILSLFQAILSAVRVTSLWSGDVTWVWDNLGNVDFFGVIIRNILTYAIVLLAIGGVYFLASLVIKKNVKFVKLLGAIVTTFIPFAVVISIISPVLSLIYSPFGLCVTIVGFVYFILAWLELVNEMIVIEDKNVRIYFHLVCLSVLIIGLGFVASRLILGSLIGGLSSLF